MKQQRKFITIAALALTLGLGVAHAQNFISLTGSIYKVTNSSGSTIKGWCSGATTTTDISNGSTKQFTCDGDLVVEADGDGATEYTISHACATAQTQATTATAGTNAGELSLATSCVYGVP